ncbi:MAG TPA: efflux RND transporter periplasmic adaptor subunit [Ignavibacteriaceae bacterium]|nr:efflux RND transporter periplasmic adaptor subunit [Ignavibacteriaceae bacterium]
MKKTKYISITVLVLAVIIAVLFYNKAKMKADTANLKFDSYPVTIAKVEKKQVTKNLELVGTIQANKDVAIIAEAQGRVVKVNAEVGDYKTAGSVLIRIDDELKLAAMKAAQVSFEKSKKDYARFQALYKGNSVTDSQLEAAKLAYQSAETQYIVAKRQYEDTKVTTPISGVVTSRLVDVGNYVKMNTPVSNVVDISKLKVNVNVSESDVFKMKVGDKVEITTEVYPGVVFNGKIATISSKADEAHTYPVEVDLPNSNQHPLKAGMFGMANFISLTKGDALLIPREALIGSIKDPEVYVVENNTAKLVKLVIGNTYDNYLEVISGLKEGQEIVVNGQNNIEDNNKVTIINK